MFGFCLFVWLVGRAGWLAQVGVASITAVESVFLKTVGRLVKPGGRIVCSTGSAADLDGLANVLALHGFVNPGKDAEQCVVHATKPTWASGVAFSLKDRRERRQTAPPPAQVIKLDVSNEDELDEELIDEDELLGEEDLVRPQPYGKTYIHLWPAEEAGAADVWIDSTPGW